MNKIYKVIWSKVKHQYVVVSELAHSNGKQSRTSRNSIRSRIAALVVCGAIAAFGVFSALPTSSAFAAAAETTSGQYIAVAFAKTDTSQINRWDWHDENCTKFNNDYEWDNRTSTWVEVTGDTREFKDAKGISHTYKLQKDSKTNKDYWVRDGYSITIENDSRFTAYDQYGKPIAPENTYIIDSQKSDSADSEGLLSSSQVVIGDDSKHTTLTGNELNSIDPGIYGGASNSGGTSVPSTWNYYINDNGEGWKDVGGPSDIANMSNFEEVHQQEDGTYNTKQNGSGITVSSDNLYVINGKLGAFFNSNGTVYTGEVYGHNNEVLMTGIENGTYYSYWGTEINDTNTSLSEMTVGDLKKIVGGINDTIYTAQGDDIKQVSVQKSGDNGGTIGLIRRGDWNGTAYEETDPVPGTITVTSTGGNGGSGVDNDVKIKFSNAENTDGFTVEAGSKVEAVIGDNDKVSQIKINGVDYQLSAGGVIGGSIDDNGNVKITQDGQETAFVGKVQDWNVKSGTVNDNGTLTLNTENAYGGDTGSVTVNNVASTGYVTNQINANNTIITEQYEDYFNENDKYLNSATFDNQSGKLKLTVAKAGDNGQAKEYEVDLSEYVTGNDVYVNAISVDKDQHKLILNRNNATQLELGLEELSDIGVSSTDYQLVENPANGSDGKYTVDNNGNLTLTVKDLNNKNAATKTITISGVAVIHDQYKDGEYTNLRDTKAQIWDETSGASDKKSSSIALGKDAFVSVQNGRKADAILFGSDTYTGGIAIGQDSKALNGTVNIGVKDYTGKMGDVIVGDPNNRDLDNGEYNTYTAMGVGETSVGSNSYISGSLSTNIGSYNVITTKYMNGGNPLDSAQNFGSITVGTLNSIESNSSDSSTLDTIFGKVSGVANSVVGMANKTQNSNGSLVFGTGNEITNSIDTIPTPSSVSGDVADVAENFRDAVSDRNKSNGGAVLAIGGGNKADYAQNSQLIGVQNEVTGTSKDISEFNMVNGYQNTVTNGSNDTVIGTKNTVTNGDSNVVLGDNHTVQDANNNVILGSSDKETTHTASDTVVIGHNAQANGNNDVAIGSGSIANGAVGTEGYAGANPIGTVSVGSEGNERTITNVAAGRINEDSTDAVNGSQLYATNQKVDAGWTATDGTTNIAVNPTETGTSTLKFAGDNNIAVTADAENNAINVELNPDVNLKGEGKNSDNRVWLSGSNGTITVTTENNLSEKTTVINGGNVYVGSSVSVGDKVEITDKDITGLSNTSWNGTTDDESRAATEGQLKDVSDTVNAGWTATDSNGASIVVNPENGSTLNFAGDRNIEVKANEKDGSIDVSLKDDIVLGGKEDTSRVEIGGTNGTIMATKDPNSMAATTTIDGGNVYVGSSISVGDKVEITDKDTTGLSNTEWNGTTTTPDRAATEGQLQQVSNDVNAGWIATDNNGSQVNITPDNNKLNFAGDENITVTAANNEIKVALNDDIVLGDYLNGDDGVLIGGSSGTISATNSITVGEDQGLVIDGQKKEIQGLSNTTWNEKIANDAAVEGSTAASTAATQGQLQEVSKVANAGWTASDGTNSISVKPNETLNFVGDENLTVSADGTDKELKVSLNDDITLGDGENAIKIDGTNGTLNIGSTFAVAEDGTVLSDGDVIADADGEKYSLSEVGKYAVRYDKTNDGTSTITLVDGDDLSGTRIKNVADGVDPKDAVNVSQLEAVEATANAGWTASDGTNSISIKPNETLNFVGDENLTVSADGTDKKLKVSLNDDITLGNTEAGNTEGERSFTINTTDPNGYVPESYKTGSGANFIEENGGFMLFATDTQGFGVFGVTAKGSAWARDFKTYTTDIYGNNTQYSLNDVGDAVAQMSSYYNGKNSYTVFSRYLNEAEKDNPFVTVDEDGNTIDATRDIPLALRDDGAVLIGATIKGEDFTDNGIRINAETKTTYDKNGNEVTNNIATITGLENTEWKPPTPVATLAANDGSATVTVTSRAATESQLNDLYSAVAAYDVNVDGTIDYSHIALAGTPYGASRSGNGTHTGGTSITNVAYASGKDGSEAVNVDYLNDAISDAAENGSISTSDQHLVANTETGSNGVYKPNDDGNVNLIVSDEKGNSSTITIGDVASKEDLDNLKDDVGDLDYSKVEGDTIIDGDSVTDAIGKLDNKIDNITGTATDADNNTVTGGKINSDGTISLTQKDKDSIKLEGQLTDSGVVQEGTSFDKETGTITITSQDKYSGETSSVKVEGIASTEVVGATNKEDLATAYKDADKDGNATTEYITDSESMVEADVALDHAIQDVAGTSYANDMVLSNRIDSVEKRLGNVEERIDKVGAMAAAIANLRTMGFDPEAPTEIAIGVGQYKSETGIAIGVFHYPNQDFMLSASLSSSGDELMGGIGATWKLGRKSAAERAKDEEARHLEQAEEMKKLAQQEKVKAQAQRHAKLLAERQQASQKNA